MNNSQKPSRSLIGIFFWILFATIVVQVCQYSSDQRLQPTNIANYTELLAQAEKGNIESVTIYRESGKAELTLRQNELGTRKLKSIVPKELLEEFTGIIRSSSPATRIIFPDESSSPWMMVLVNWLPMLLMVGFFVYFLRQTTAGNGKAFTFGKSKAKLYSEKNNKIRFKDVAGQDEAKEELKEIVEFLKDPLKFQKVGGKIPKGVLLMGPPGVGKTLLARAVAGEAGVPFFSISGSDFVEMFVGVGASRVRDLFDQGKKNAPCIIFIDELDSVGRHRGTGVGGGHDEKEQTLNQLLAEMDGFESNEGVITVGATNRPDVLDPALLRPGRFDRQVVLGRPDIKGREEILKVHLKRVPADENVNLSKIARGTVGFSGADLASLVNEAALNAARHDRTVVGSIDLEFAKDKIMMGAERRSMVISDSEKRTTAVHEAGHALIAILLRDRGADPLHKVTIIPRGMAMGLTQQLPLEDKHNYSREYLTSQLTILMGGKCAEKVILDQETTGASNDIERATELAQQMVCDWGMSEELGPQKFGNKETNPFLGKSMAERSRDCSEQTAQLIDSEVKKLIKTAYDEALRMIQEYKDAVIRMTEALIERETIDGDEMLELAGL